MPSNPETPPTDIGTWYFHSGGARWELANNEIDRALASLDIVRNITGITVGALGGISALILGSGPLGGVLLAGYVGAAVAGSESVKIYRFSALIVQDIVDHLPSYLLDTVSMVHRDRKIFTL